MNIKLAVIVLILFLCGCQHQNDWGAFKWEEEDNNCYTVVNPYTGDTYKLKKDKR